MPSEGNPGGSGSETTGLSPGWAEPRSWAQARSSSLDLELVVVVVVGWLLLVVVALLLLGVVLAPMLVTTLVSQTLCHAAGLVATQNRTLSIQHCPLPLLHPALLLPRHPKKTWFLRWSQEAPPVFLTPQQQTIMFFSMISRRTLPCNLTEKIKQFRYSKVFGLVYLDLGSEKQILGEAPPKRIVQQLNKPWRSRGQKPTTEDNCVSIQQKKFHIRMCFLHKPSIHRNKLKTKRLKISVHRFEQLS